MWIQQDSTNLLTRFILSIVIIAHHLDIILALSDKRLCADENCEEVISLGIGVISYPAAEEGMVSFQKNSIMQIKSKGAGNNPELWGIEINGRKGYAPKKFIKETKTIIREKDLKFVVDVVPPNAVPILTTSENLVEPKNSIETTTTPLNLTPEESTGSHLKSSSNEKFSEETSPVTTPVTSEIVDNTEVPIFSNESDNVVKTEGKYTDYDEKEKILVDVNDKTNKENEYITVISDKNSINAKSVDDILNTLPKITENHKEPETINEEIAKVELIKKTAEVLSETSEENEIKHNEQEIGIQYQKFLTQTEKNPKEFSFGNLNKISPQIEDNETILKDDRNNNSDDAEYTNNYNLTESNNADKDNYNIPKDQDYTSIGTLDVNATEPLIDLILENKEIHNDDNLQHQQENQKGQFHNENTIEQYISDKQVEIDYLNNMPTQKENLIKEPINAEVVTSIDTDKNDEVLSDNLQLTSDSIFNSNNEIPERMPNTEEVVTEGIYLTTNNVQRQNPTDTEIKSKEISSENLQETSTKMERGEEHNNNALEKNNTKYNAGKIDIVGEITNSNSINNNNSDNQQNSKDEQIAKEIPYQQIKTDEQLKFDSVKSVPEILDTPYYNDNMLKEPINTEYTTNPKSDEEIKTSNDYLPLTEEAILNTDSKNPEKVLIHDIIVSESIDPTTSNPNEDILSDIPLPAYDHIYQELTVKNIPLNDNFKLSGGAEENLNLFDQTTESYKSIPTIPSDTVLQPLQQKDEQNKAPPSLTPFSFDYEAMENKGLFATIMGTVNNMLPLNKKNKQNGYDGDHKSDRILLSKNKNGNKIDKIIEESGLEYCKNIGPNGDCPQTNENQDHSAAHSHHTSTKSILYTDLTLDTFLQTFASKILENSNLLVFLVIVAATSLLFSFGYYCFCTSSREGALLLKLNQLESSLLASFKENSILKHNLMSTRQKLASIEDNSFGSNDMVVSLKKELEEELIEKTRLQEQIVVLQKELENAADAGIELNKIVSELLSNQTGDENIISSVEELQKQLNEQQNTILEINASLAEKSRENSELQLLIAEQNARYEAELANLQRDNDELEHEKGTLLTRLDEMKNDFDNDITAALEGKNLEIKRLQSETIDLTNKIECEHTKWLTSLAKVEALEECLKNIRKDPHVNIAEVIDVANVKAQLIETEGKYKSLKEKLETELDSRKLVENQLGLASTEVEKLKQDFNQSEKDKLEAQTRLEVLSNYFKDKENQLQKELSLKEAMWLKQQGETTTTVDRVTAMQEEIQSLKSQNDSLRAEIEALVAAHKAQTGTLENRAHETWLAARQSDRRYEEARAEATALRRKLTALANGNAIDGIKPSAGPAGLPDELTQAPSPIHMESPGSPLMGRMPPPPFLPPPFMGPPPPFMGMPPPPPFVSPGGMHSAPLGRIMSPGPQRSGRFSPQHLDYEDYLNYEGNNTWHRHTYSQPPRSYRSLSPSDSRYNYGTERDTYDTETDFSPPPSPRAVWQQQ